MKFWLNANLSPKIAKWLSQEFEVDCNALLDMHDESLSDDDIFLRAKAEKAIVITKDFDFVNLVISRGAPPQVLILTVGNCTNRDLIQILKMKFPAAMKLLIDGHDVVEIRK